MPIAPDLTAAELRMILPKARLPTRQRRTHWRELFEASDAELAEIDPVEMDLLIAAGVPSLSDLSIPRYQAQVDEWAEIVLRAIPRMTAGYFLHEPDSGSLQMFLATSIIRLIDEHLGIAYKEDHKQGNWFLCTDPTDLFLNGVIDTRRGTCGNMALLAVSIAWRIGWPLFLATAGPHSLCRFDDGEVRFNIEATNTGRGGVSVPPDEFYFGDDWACWPQTAATGGDLRPLTPREMLSISVHHRARHFDNLRTAGGPTHLVQWAEEDYMRAVDSHPQFWYHRERLEQLQYWGTSVRPIPIQRKRELESEPVYDVQYEATESTSSVVSLPPSFLSPFMQTESQEE